MFLLPTSMLKQRGFVALPIILVIFLLVIGGVYYYQTHKETFQDRLSKQNPNIYLTPPSDPTNPPATNFPQTDETKSWKTYESKVFKLVVKYPSNLQLVTTYEHPKSDMSAQIQIRNGDDYLSLLNIVCPEYIDPSQRKLLLEA